MQIVSPYGLTEDDYLEHDELKQSCGVFPSPLFPNINKALVDLRKVIAKLSENARGNLERKSSDVSGR